MINTKPAIKSSEIITSVLTLGTTLYYLFHGSELPPEDQAKYLAGLTSAYSIYIMYARTFITNSKISGIFKCPPVYLLLSGDNTILSTFTDIKEALLFVKQHGLTRYSLIDEQSGEIILKVMQEMSKPIVNFQRENYQATEPSV